MKRMGWPAAAMMLLAGASQGGTLDLDQALQRARASDLRIVESGHLVETAWAMPQQAGEGDGLRDDLDVLVGLRQSGLAGAIAKRAAHDRDGRS